MLKPDEYYIENERMVFTEKYHLRRGHCCKNGCRHCPYGDRKDNYDYNGSDKRRSPNSS